MENERRLTSEEYEKIEMLVNGAIMAGNKKEANTYINRLEFMKGTLKIGTNSSYILSELIAYTKDASGQVSEKEHWIGAVKLSLYKLKPTHTENN